MILVDTLRADHVGACGSAKGLTPNIDALAEQGTVFSNALASSSWTRASVASLFTGRFPSALGCVGRNDGLADSASTLAESLKATGDFDCIGLYANGNVSPTHGFAQGYDSYRTPSDDLLAGYPDDVLVHPAEAITREALEELAAWRATPAASGRSLFLSLHYIDPHSPYLPHGPENPRFADGRFSGSRTDLEAMDSESVHQLSEQDRGRIQALYRGEVRYCDEWIGRLLEGVSQQVGSLDDVFVVLTSDHGEGLWDHTRRGHGIDLFEEQIRVPLIIKPHAAPVAAPVAARSDALAASFVSDPVSLLDVAPTVLAAVGVPTVEAHQGHDLSPYLSSNKGLPLGATSESTSAPARESVYSELDMDEAHYRVLRRGSQKLMENLALPAEHRYRFTRFDLSRDAAELNSLFDVQAPSKIDQALRQELEQTSREISASRTDGLRVEQAELDAETYESLRALGYIGDDR